MMDNRNEVGYLPVRTVVKFYENHETTNANAIFSKTLLKVAFIDHDWKDKGQPEEPKDGEFWLVDVVHETCAGQPKGCFLLHPIRKVEATMLNRLLPGMYDEINHNGCMVLEPKSGGVNWLVPQRHKKAVKDAYAIVVKQ